MKVGSDDPVACLPPRSPHPPRLRPPAGSWDVHAHVIGRAPDHPWVTPRSYDPPAAPVSAYIHLLDTLGLDYGVLVQVSVHGTDNRLLFEGLAQYPDRLRGVVAVRENVDDADLARFHEAGVRGVRIATVVHGGVPLAAAATMAARVATYGWHVEFALHGAMLPTLAPMLRDFPTPVVIAHFGDCAVEDGIDGAQFRALADLVTGGRCYVKLSGAYRLAAAPWRALDRFARALIALRADRMLWGSDWPHVALTRPETMPDTSGLFDILSDWVPDDEAIDRILVANPAELYGIPGG